MEKQKILIFGTGKKGINFLNLCRERGYDNKIEVINLIDNNPEKWGKAIGNYEIVSPSEVKKLEFDFIIVASTFYQEIEEQLKNEYNISVEKILYSDDFVRQLNIQNQYEKRYGASCPKGSYTIPKKLVVYTANIGDYDELEDPQFIDPNIEYVCFTDDVDFKSDIWQVRLLNRDEIGENPLKVRELKFFPHKLFPEYDMSIWLDSKYVIKGDIREYVAKYYQGNKLLFFPHYSRDCIYEEAIRCIQLQKGDPAIIEQQITHYRNQGYPEHNGMCEGACIVREHNDIRLQELMEAWWLEVNRFSRRDQISLPYVMWKNQYICDICDLDIERNDYLKLKPHKKA